MATMKGAGKKSNQILVVFELLLFKYREIDPTKVSKKFDDHVHVENKL